MMLNQCTKDFQSLIERLQLLRAYEDADENNRCAQPYLTFGVDTTRR